MAQLHQSNETPPQAHYQAPASITASLQEAQAMIHLGSWEWDVAANHIYWSDELYRIFGLKPQEREISFEEFTGLIHEDDRERITSKIDQASRNGGSFEFDHRIKLPNGKIRLVHGKGKAIFKSGKLTRMLGTTQDITEQKRAEQALRQSDERFSAVTAATSDLVYDVDLRTNQVWFNDVIYQEYGYTTGSVGKSSKWWTQHIHPEDRHRVSSEIEEIITGKRANWIAEYRFAKADGAYVDVRNRSHILRDNDGQPLRMIGSVLDITQQKELERAKDKFVSLVSHQLRTPLTAMRLLSEMLVDGHAGELAPKQAELIGKIATSTNRMIGLVNDILNVSQIERGRLKVVPLPSDMPALIHWHIDEVLPLAEEKNVRIVYHPSKKVTEADVDPILFGQILHNLLTNAIRYSDKPNSKIQVVFDMNNQGYVLKVTDEGIGIPLSEQGYIFSSFFRAGNAVKMQGDGNGLGLYLVKLILDATDGNIKFTSRTGHGCTFIVTLPPGGMRSKAGDKTLAKESA